MEFKYQVLFFLKVENSISQYQHKKRNWKGVEINLTSSDERWRNGRQIVDQ
jgi:hypothetical protein